MSLSAARGWVRAPALILLAVALAACSTTSQFGPTVQGRSGAVPPQKLNPYVVRAVEMLARDRARQGYGNKAFTQDLKFGKGGTLPASGKPLTMCVAAQMEVLVEALNLYADETGDYRPFEFLPKSSWVRQRPTDLRGQVWLVEGASSWGAADALRNFGMGARTTFDKLEPGDFVNFNRMSGKGHGVVFMAYLDAAGNEIPTAAQASGFRYFSSQGKEVGGGLDYRYAFFHPVCPKLGDDKKRDCGVIRSSSPRLLNMGSAWLPASWDETQARIWIGAGRAGALAPDGTFDEEYFSGSTTDD